MTHPRLLSSGRRGFTLIELLTVIAIIGILAAIIIPVAGKVRETANKSQCTSNIRQIGMAMVLYASDNKGYYPAVADQRGLPLGTGIFSKALIDSGHLGRKAGIWVCATHRSKDSTVDEREQLNNLNHAPRSYGISENMQGITRSPYTNAEQVPMHVRQIPDPSLTIMLGEWHSPSSGVVFGHSNATAGTMFTKARVEGARDGALGSFLSYHPGAHRNFAFADGHIRYMSLTAAAEDQYWKVNK